MTKGSRLLSKISPYAQTFEALGHPIRFAILYLLMESERDFRELADLLKVAKPTLLHHLYILQKQDWIARQKYGKRVWYTTNPKATKQLKKLAKEYTPFQSYITQMFE